MTHISINTTNKTVYWIFYNTSDQTYLSGQTAIGQVSEASDQNWSLHLQTTIHEQWVEECNNLDINT